MKENFNSTHRIVSKHLYALLADMTEDERRGALIALSTLSTVAEDGYLAINNNGATLHQDFYIQCFDILLSSSLAQKMIYDDGLAPEITKTYKIKKETLIEAEFAYKRIEDLVSKINYKISQDTN